MKATCSSGFGCNAAACGGLEIFTVETAFSGVSTGCCAIPPAAVVEDPDGGLAGCFCAAFLLLNSSSCSGKKLACPLRRLLNGQMHLQNDA